ncbi:MAG: RNA polymerase sigma-70 factor [Candidatus Marinimicrobia bacterium]|nr:RNA polymerase sigma-70 factor [Candidatus Neomarinimicrobiota bacterium]MBL7010834.1 RNA polymerase sigma-70 factor [Candidatus Neomarinimicrobiota bacterium]MBL7030118.1 RNA polymerase sigma-70 factor [Candidatus Neomarinimicrobiota bacterium]
MKNHTELQLLEKIKTGDKKAFRKIFQLYHQPLFRFTVSRVHDPDIASDIVQDSFVRVWKNRKYIQSKKSFFSYIATIASNLTKDHFRHQAVRQKHESQIESELYTAAENIENREEKEEIQKNILEAIHSHLPEKCRNIFILSRIEGLSSKEIADVMNLSVRTVENQLYRGLKILRNKLSKCL